ncbi:MAG TPA: hypothetical protein VKA86_19535 [Candidatus Krumholzibacteria bacterium]|nr:hypothetical protein [Candidatus Krumholzibacteria bacterium]
MQRGLVGLVLTVVVCTTSVTAAQAQWRFAVGLSGGVSTGDRIYRAQADDDVSWRWELPTGGSDVRGTEVLVESAGVFEADNPGDALQFGARFTVFSNESPWGGILSFGLSDLDVEATRRTTQDNVDEVPWDQFFTTQVHAVGTYSIQPKTSTPYLLAGLAWVSLDSEGDALDQSSPALVLGGGYRIGGRGAWMFDVEIRGVWASLDLDDEQARLETGIEQQAETRDTASGFEFVGEDTYRAIEFTVSTSLAF